MDPAIPCIDSPSYRRHLIAKGLLVPVESRRIVGWWHPTPRTVLLLGIPEEKVVVGSLQ
jgi:hypothetical protein